MEEKFALPSSAVREILHNIPVDSLPPAPDFLCQMTLQVAKTAGTISSGIEMVSASMSMVRGIADQLEATGHRLENPNTEIIQDDQ